MIRLDPPLPLETPKGLALAYFLIDYGIDYNLLWVCFINSTRECWTFANPQIRGVRNETFGCGLPGAVIQASQSPHPGCIQTGADTKPFFSYPGERD